MPNNPQDEPAYIASRKVRVDLKLQPEYVAPEVKVEKVELSANIKWFDKKAGKVLTRNPYEFNAISLKKIGPPTPPPSDAIQDPIYHELAKILGVDTLHDWGESYDRVVQIAEWAKTKVRSHESAVPYIYQMLKEIPSITGHRLGDVYLFMKMNRVGKKAIKSTHSRNKIK